MSELERFQNLIESYRSIVLFSDVFVNITESYRSFVLFSDVFANLTEFIIVFYICKYVYTEGCKVE